MKFNFVYNPKYNKKPNTRFPQTLYLLFKILLLDKIISNTTYIYDLEFTIKANKFLLKLYFKLLKLNTNAIILNEDFDINADIIVFILKIFRKNENSIIKRYFFEKIFYLNININPATNFLSIQKIVNLPLYYNRLYNKKLSSKVRVYIIYNAKYTKYFYCFLKKSNYIAGYKSTIIYI